MEVQRLAVSKLCNFPATYVLLGCLEYMVACSALVIIENVGLKSFESSVPEAR